MHTDWNSFCYMLIITWRKVNHLLLHEKHMHAIIFMSYVDFIHQLSKWVKNIHLILICTFIRCALLNLTEFV